MLAAHIAGNTTSYSTIQAAVDAAVAGATITVDPGTYNETVTIAKQLTLKGAQAGIDARNTRGAESIVFATQTVFSIFANDVTIDGFTIQGNRADIGAKLGAGVLMQSSIHGTQVLNNVIQNNVTGIYLSNNSNTDAAVIQHNLIQNNFEANNFWTKTPGENGSRGIYTDGTISGGLLTNVLIDSNRLYNSNFSGGDEDMGMISLQALTAGKQFNITITNNFIGNESKALLATNVTNFVFVGNTVTQLNDGPSGPLRFEGNANTVDIQYNSIYGNAGSGVAVDSSGVPGDSSGFVVNNNNIYQNNGIGVIVVASQYNGPLITVGDWWGSASGPGGMGPGTGQQVWSDGQLGHGVTPKGLPGGGPVTFSPWATALIDITKIPAPAAATGLTVTPASATQLNLAWTPAMSTANSQLLQRSTDGVTFATIAVVPALLNSYTDTVTAGTGYTYRVVATNATGNAPASNLATYAPAAAPTAPQLLSAAGVSSSAIALIWQATGTTQTSFNVLRSSDGTTFTTIATALPGNTTTYTDSAGLAVATSYSYRIIAVNSIGSSPASNTVVGTTLSNSTITTPISSIPWTSATAGWGTVQLNASIKGNTLKLHGVSYAGGIGTHAASTITYNLAGKYVSFQSDVGIDDEEIGVGSGSVDFQVVGDGRTLYDSGVLTSSSATAHIAVSVAGVQTLQLIATNGVVGSIDYDHADWAGAALVSTPTAPAAPTNLAAVALSQTTIKLSWTPSVGATSYAIDRSSDNVNFTSVVTVAGSVTSWTDPAILTANTQYYYRIRAINSAGASGNSNVAGATTLQIATVTYISDLTWASATAGWGTVQQNASIKGNPLTLHGTTYAKGIGTHAASTITYNLAGKYTSFLSDIGIDDEEIGIGSGSVIFQVIGDGKVLYTSGTLTSASPTVSINVNITGVQTLQLVATNAIAGDIDYDHADWAGARLLG